MVRVPLWVKGVEVERPPRVKDAGMTRELTADDFLRGLLAALAFMDKKSLGAVRPRIHRAFRRVVDRAQEPSFGPDFTVDLTAVDFDPLFGQSRWLDRALTRAQRGRVISFPNPSYEVMQVRFDQHEADRILDQLGARERFLELAQVFAGELPSAERRSAAT